MKKVDQGYVWPFTGFTPDQLNRGAGKHLGKLIENCGICGPDDLADALDNSRYNRIGKETWSITDSQHMLEKYDLSELFSLGVIGATRRLDLTLFNRTKSHQPTQVLLDLDVPRLQCLQPGVDAPKVLQDAITGAFSPEPGRPTIADWFVDNEEFSSRYAGSEVERIRQVVTIRACAAHTGKLTGDQLMGMPLAVSRGIYAFEATDHEFEEALAWLMVWQARETAKRDRVGLLRFWRHDILMSISNLYAFLWHLKGISLGDITSKIRSRLTSGIKMLFNETDADLIFEVVENRVAHFLSAFPESWAEQGFRVEQALGMQLDVIAGRESFLMSHGGLAEPIVKREQHTSTFPKLALKYFASHDPSIYNAEHVDRAGSRIKDWKSGVSDWAPGAEKLNLMLQKGQWHPALEGLTTADFLDGEASAIAAANVYLTTGGNANRARAQALVSKHPCVLDGIIKGIKKRSEVQRLAAMVDLSPAQIEMLPAHMIDSVLVVDLGL